MSNIEIIKGSFDTQLELQDANMRSIVIAA